GDDAHGKSSDASVATDESLAVFRLVFVEAAAVQHARQNLLHVVGARGGRIVDAVNLFGGQHRLHRFLAVPAGLAAVSPLFNDGADARQAGRIVGLAEIY